MNLISIVILFFIGLPASGSAKDTAQIPIVMRWCFEKIGDNYEVDWGLNPAYVRGDFDRSGKNDYAVAVKERVSSKMGIVICHWPSREPVVLGAGREFEGADELIFDHWEADFYRAGHFMIDAICIRHPDGSKTTIVWNRKRYIKEEWWEGKSLGCRNPEAR